MATIISYSEILLQEKINGSENYSLNLKKSIADIIVKNSFLDYTIDVKDIDANNGNYLARLYEVDIKGITEESKKEVHLFIKECLLLEKMKLVSLKEVYDKEVFIYLNYANVANKLQIEAKIPEHDRFKFVPAYGGNSEIIILENLSKHSFKTYYRMDVMSKKFAELAIMELAKYHALGFVVERKLPEFFDKQIKTKISSYNNFDDEWSEYITKLCDYTAKIIDEAPPSLANYAPKMKENFILYMTKPGNFKKTLCHGDYRMNNILVKEIDGEPREVSVVDYQFIDYGNPVRDFLYLLYTSSDRKFRQKHLADLKNIYHDTLKRFLSYFELDVDNVYSREDFEKAYTEIQEFGLVIGMFSAPFHFATESEKVDAISEFNFTTMDIRYKHRMQGLIEEFVELGYL